MGTDEIIDGDADCKLGLEPTLRASKCRCFACQVRIPEAPVEIGALHISGIDGLAGRILKSLLDTPGIAISHLAFSLDDPPGDAGLVHRGIVQVVVNYAYRIHGPSPFASTFTTIV